ncbi:MAG: hemolysin family protein [Coriobacteriales bacterium]|jgi:putative hemolysin|nr:hemolysin family protein [Coriobacteriales bacterium]
MSFLFGILIIVLLILFNGYFSMSEMALINVRRSVLQHKIDEPANAEEARRAQKVLDMTTDTDRLLATIQVAITLLSFGASAVAATSFTGPIVTWLRSFGVAWLSTIAGPLALVLITLLISYFSLVIGELVPKRMALSNAEKYAMRVVAPIRFLEYLARPLVFLLSSSTNTVAKIFGIRSADDRQSVSEDDIKFFVAEQDSLLDEEKRMIHEIFDLGDTVVREVMVPRVDMIAIEDDATVGQTLNRMRGTGHSRVPVFQQSPDRIIGIVMLKDLLAPLTDERINDPAVQYMREPMFIPETKNILPLLGEMQTSHQQIAIVVDEYGGTAGIISIEDIVEEIVGEISDEYDPDNKFQTQISENEWLIDGRFPTDDAIELGFPVKEGDDYETVAGWLLDTLDHLPEIGDQLELDGYTFKVQSMRRKRISMVRVTRDPNYRIPDAEGEGS